MTSAIVVLVILVLIGGFALYNYRSGQASVAFGAAMQDYQTPLAPVGQPVPAGIKTYPTAIARAKAANVEFAAVADKYSMTPDGKVARYFAGLTSIEANDNAAAEASLKQVADGWNGNLAALAKLSLAQLYRQTNRDPQAIELYNQLNAKPTSTVPAGLAQLQLAELYESEGNPVKAKEIYAQLKDKDAKGPVGQLAAQKLNPAPAGPAGAPQAQ
jgi:predicted negative regulator of RcsB-dependent stress response